MVNFTLGVIKINPGSGILSYFSFFSDSLNFVVLILNCKLNSLSQILPVLEKVHGAEKSVLVIANDIEDEATQAMVANATKGLLKICAIKSPFYGEKRSQVLNDLATVLGGVVVNDLETKEIERLSLSSLGVCKRVEISNNETLFVECGRKNAPVNEETINESLDLLEKELQQKDLSKEEEAFLKQRLVILKGVIAILSIGAYNESELLEKFDRVDDALHATKAAMDGGFLPGGGVALLRAGQHLAKSETSDLKEKTINKIMADSCLAPIKQILRNADLSFDYISEKIGENSEFNWGYDVRAAQYCDMINAGIIDPLPVTVSAIRNAASVASSLINVGCVILDSPEAYAENDVQLVELADEAE